jgi:competence protein ComEA
VVKLSEVLLLLPYAQRHGHDDPEMHKVQQKINHQGIKRDCHGIILLERRCKFMNKPSRTANSRHQLLFFGITLLGIILLASALWQPASIEPPGWVAVNNQVEQVLTGQERAQESLAAAVGKTNEASAANETIKVTNSVQSVEGTVKTEGKQLEASSAAGKLPLDATSNKLDINQATAEQLDALPGIGAVKAQTIVSDREKNGLFHSVDDLLRVKGIGPKLLKKMKASIVAQP